MGPFYNAQLTIVYEYTLLVHLYEIRTVCIIPQDLPSFRPWFST